MGRDSGRHGLWYETGGTTTVGAVEPRDDAGTVGELDLKGGTLSVGSTLLIGRQGFGSLTLGSGALTAQTLSIAMATTSDHSYFIQAGRAASVSGNVFVGAGGAGHLVLHDGSFAWGGTVTLAGGSAAWQPRSHPPPAPPRDRESNPGPPRGHGRGRRATGPGYPAGRKRRREGGSAVNSPWD